MDVRRLHYFLGIVEAGSISRAAAELRVAQSAPIQHAANIETGLGARLLLRSRRSVRPAECGRRLVEHARLTLGRLGAIEDIRSYGRAPTGGMTIGLSAGMAALIAAPLS
jgi:LysR family nitrogen assimilation transcriptional regulator